MGRVARLLAFLLILDALVCSDETCLVLNIIEEAEETLGKLVNKTKIVFKNRCTQRSCKTCAQLACEAEITDANCADGFGGARASLFGETEIPTFSGECSHNCTPRRIDFGHAGIRSTLDSSVDDHRFEACWTEPLDDVFAKTLHDTNSSTLTFQYIGTPIGTARIYPGASQKVCYDYDPRLRPWYIAATSGQKNVVIILDVSESMNDFGRLEAVKQAVTNIINSLILFDYVGVVVFSTDARSLQPHLLQGTRANLDKLISGVNQLTASGGTNYEAAFTEAFEMVNRSLIRGEIARCNTAILFVTDGIPTVGERDIDRLVTKILTMGEDLDTLNDGTPVFFTFVLGTTVRLDIPRRLACKSDGFYASVPDGDNLLKAMRSYADYFSILRKRPETAVAVWVEPYIDAFGLGEITTVSQAVYEDDGNGNLALTGVLGIDITVGDLRSAAMDNDTLWREVLSCLASRISCPRIQKVPHCFLNYVRQKKELGLCGDGRVCPPDISDRFCDSSKEELLSDFCAAKRESFAAAACCVGSQLTSNTFCSRNLKNESLQFSSNILVADNAQFKSSTGACSILFTSILYWISLY